MVLTAAEDELDHAHTSTFESLDHNGLQGAHGRVQWGGLESGAGKNTFSQSRKDFTVQNNDQLVWLPCNNRSCQ